MTKTRTGALGARPEDLPAYHTVVFGSGLAGLSCARKLALDSRRVAVLEKAQHLGGHLLPFQRRGVTFEVGIHYIAAVEPGGQWANALDELGVSPTYVPLDDDFEEVRYPDGTTATIGAPLGAFIERLQREYPRQARGLARYRDDLEALWELLDSGVEFPLRTPTLLLALLSSKKAPRLARLATLSTRRYFASLGITGRLYETLTVQHVLIGSSPNRLAALVFLLVNAYYFHRPCFVEGGGQALIDALLHPSVEYETRADARIEEATRAERAAHPGARYAIVHSDNRRLLAENVVWTPDPRLLEQATRVRPGLLLRARLHLVEDPHALAIGYYATRQPLEAYGIGNRNYWLMGDLSPAEVYAQHSLEQLATRGPLYVSTGSLRDPLAVPPDNSLGAAGVFQAMFLVPSSPDVWDAQDSDHYRDKEPLGSRRAYYSRKEHALELLTERVTKEWPDLDGDLVWQELGTPLTHRRFMNSVNGNGYGYEPTVRDLLVGRPSYLTGLPGLYLAGQHVKPAHGIVTALVNGVGVARAITSR